MVRYNKLSVIWCLCFAICSGSIEGTAQTVEDNDLYGLPGSDERLLGLIGAGVGLAGWGLGSLKTELDSVRLANLSDEVMWGVDNLLPLQEYSSSAGTVSDIGLAVSFGFPYLATVFSSRLGSRTVEMYSQAQLFNVGLVTLVKNLVDKERPYLYGTKLSTEQKLRKGSDALKSFYSGHASTTFTAAVFMSQVYSKVITTNDGWMWSTTLLTASLTSYLRYDGGMHFLSDILIGAVIGSAIGYLVPELYLK